AGLLPPSSGQVIVNGREVAGPPANLVLLFQEYNKSLFAWRTVFGNVRFGLDARRNPSADAADRARSLVELVGLKGFEDHYPWDLSAAIQKPVAIPRASASKREVLWWVERSGWLNGWTLLGSDAGRIRLWPNSRPTIFSVI